MLTEIKALIEYYWELISNCPVWLAAVCAAAHAAAVVLCVAENRGDRASLPNGTGRNGTGHNGTGHNGTSRNTVHTVFWLCALLMFPFIGIALYLLLSVLPYRLWKRSAGENDVFPLTFRLRRSQLGALFIFGTAGVFLQFAADLAGLRLSGMSLGFEAAFICWTVTVLRDWNESLYKRAIYLSFRPAGEGARLIPEEDYFGRKRYVEAAALTFAGELSRRLVRAAANEVFRELDEGGTPVTGELSSSVGELRYGVFADQRLLERRYVDTLEVKYLGGGISRFVIYDWSEIHGELECVKRVIYRAAPEARHFLIRSLILLFAAAALYSPWYGIANKFILNLFFA